MHLPELHLTRVHADGNLNDRQEIKKRTFVPNKGSLPNYPNAAGFSYLNRHNDLRLLQMGCRIQYWIHRVKSISSYLCSGWSALQYPLPKSGIFVQGE